jgi:hypothetical protein
MRSSNRSSLPHPLRPHLHLVRSQHSALFPAESTIVHRSRASCNPIRPAMSPTLFDPLRFYSHHVSGRALLWIERSLFTLSDIAPDVKISKEFVPFEQPADPHCIKIAVVGAANAGVVLHIYNFKTPCFWHFVLFVQRKVDNVERGARRKGVDCVSDGAHDTRVDQSCADER